MGVNTHTGKWMPPVDLLQEKNLTSRITA